MIHNDLGIPHVKEVYKRCVRYHNKLEESLEKLIQYFQYFNYFYEIMQ